MARKINSIGSVSAVKQAEQENQDPNSTITSDPTEHDVAERDSGDELDPSTTDPVETDGNVHGIQDQTNETVASGNPTNAEAAEQKELLDGLEDNGVPNPNTDPDVFDGSASQVTEDEFNELLNADLDPEEEDVQLSDEEIARAAAELDAERTGDEGNTSTDNQSPSSEVKPDGDALDTAPVKPQGNDEDEANPEPVGVDGRANFNLDQEAATAPVTKHVVGNDGQIEDVSDEMDQDADEGELAPAHNGSGHRNTFINSKGDITVMDDETADRFYNDPKFYEYTYDAATGKNIHVSFLRWANGKGEAVGGVVGDSYEQDK